MPWSAVPGRVRLGLAGDVMLGRLVDRALAAQPATYAWGDLLPLLLSTDINLVNLEAALTHCPTPVPKVFNFRGDPERVAVLRAARIDLVSLANNHVLDFGEAGLRETLAVLDGAGIAHVGAGVDAAAAHQLVTVERHGLRLGFIGYTDNEPGWQAGEGPGTSYLQVGDIGAVRADLAALRSRADLVVASLHWGPNMRLRPAPEFVDFAHALVDLGVDIVHGHSAHLFQGIELYRGGLILYDTGDFLDDYAVDPLLRNDWTFLFLVEVSRRGIEGVHLVPAVIARMQVRRAVGDDCAAAVQRMQQLAAEFGTTIAHQEAVC